MLHKKNPRSASAPAPAADAEKPAPASQPAQPAAPSPAAPSPAVPAKETIEATKPVASSRPVGRPATKPHCLKCGKRLERCQCKDGAQLAAEVAAAAEEAKKKSEVKPIDCDEAEQILRFFCWVLGMGESAIAAMLAKIPWEQAEEAYSYTEDDIARLLPPAHRILAKYAYKLPAWIRDYRDEFALAIAFQAVQRAKQERLAAVIVAHADREKQQREKENANPKVTVLPRDIADPIGKNSAPAAAGSN